MTNFERIKAMSVEEMVEFLRNYKKCKMCGFFKEETCTSTECMYSVQQLLESEAQENDRHTEN